MRLDADTSGGTGQVRVILGAGCYLDAEAALSLAVVLARQFSAELHGVFVRDEAILAATAGPLACVVSYSGNQVGDATGNAMLHAFQTDSRRFQRHLQARAREAALESSFREETGRLPEALQQAANAGDFVVYGLKPTIRTGGPLALVLGKGQVIPGFARRLAKQLDKTLVVLMPTGTATETGTHLLATHHAERPPLVRFYDQPDALLQLLEQMSATATILTAPRSALPPVYRILEAARSSVILAQEPKEELSSPPD